ncbi:MULTISPECIES: serine/threonine-protein kinase [Sorangium]|uniref:Protein kinase n=1 Tax=Sorangium cellulosum TaxID=56 RepID=A0A4P2R540_SORCE|nr:MULTISPECIES: serine/threonine-protein kinase [Sorangium]AUX37878.1 protein kinase [Sorangium cellulosum]WCQ97166.1 serine-threonine kinase [Sorangium sp. Soce836]
MRGLEEIQGLEIGTLIAGKYRVDRLLDKGAMGAVIAATHMDLGELRAIKLLLPATAADPEMCERFLREARIAARLKSEHAVKVHDVGRLPSGLPFMVMEFLDGRDLRVIRKKRGPLPVEEATLYVIQACDALAEAHALGLVHRDVKPANLFLTHTREGTPCIKVLDFGISKVSEAASLGVSEMRTSTGQMLGTPHYMPPEQMRGQRDVDARADIWAVGSLLYVLLTGRYPMHARSVQTVSLVLGGKFVPPLPSQVRRGLTPEIDPIIMRCLERDRDRRWPDLAELTLALRPFAPPAAEPLVERIQRILRGGLRDSLSGVRAGVDGEGAGERGPISAAPGSGPPSGGAAFALPAEGLPSPVPPPSAPGGEVEPEEQSEVATLPDTPRARAEAAAGETALAAGGETALGPAASCAQADGAVAPSEAVTAPAGTRGDVDEDVELALVDASARGRDSSAMWERRLRSPSRAGFVVAALAAVIVAALLVSGAHPGEPPPGPRISGAMPAVAPAHEARGADAAGQALPSAVASAAPLPPPSGPVADLQREALRDPLGRMARDPSGRTAAVPGLPASRSLPVSGSSPRQQGIPVSAPPR